MNSTPPNYKPAVVIPAYRRPAAFRRLLRSVNDAEYPEAGCTLILSLEGGADDEVIRIAENFDFKYGDKRVVRHDAKLGLKAHIYECADYSQEFESVIVLEEDLIVSPAFYLYAIRALAAYQNSKPIAGISLYAQRFNETAQLPFEPMPSYYAGYFMQLACSWGQAWTAEQWEAYQKWIKENPVPGQIDDVRIPKNIREWPAESWKREFNWYLLQTERTFFYPYQSVTTNSSHHGGENMSDTGSLFDVPVVSAPDAIDGLYFPSAENALISYDMYMEADGGFIKKMTGFGNNQLTMDLYGMKPVELLKQFDWSITCKKNNHPVQSFALQNKPVEWNIQNSLENSSRDAFFSLVNPNTCSDFKRRKWADVQLAIHLAVNRLGAIRLVRNILLYQLKRYLKF